MDNKEFTESTFRVESDLNDLEHRTETLDDAHSVIEQELISLEAEPSKILSAYLVGGLLLNFMTQMNIAMFEATGLIEQSQLIDLLPFAISITCTFLASYLYLQENSQKIQELKFIRLALEKEMTSKGERDNLDLERLLDGDFVEMSEQSKGDEISSNLYLKEQ
ncbi:MAG: hypothetical protein Q9M91_01840 [Candidatus Dojkabacteria bacterium]|nr:hypothetical protein [Candidatus Dojkabacteria bacterium]MDQ7020566.1 hypothetical protein [Candidatus Dojkabacteria bacterium]